MKKASKVLYLLIGAIVFFQPATAQKTAPATPWVEIGTFLADLESHDSIYIGDSLVGTAPRIATVEYAGPAFGIGADGTEEYHRHGVGVIVSYRDREGALKATRLSFNVLEKKVHDITFQLNGASFNIYYRNEYMWYGSPTSWNANQQQPGILQFK